MKVRDSQSFGEVAQRNMHRATAQRGERNTQLRANEQANAKRADDRRGAHQAKMAVKALNNTKVEPPRPRVENKAPQTNTPKIHRPAQGQKIDIRV